MSCAAHDSAKSQKMVFLGNTDNLFTCGFTKSNERQIKLYDMRNFSESIQSVHVDSQIGPMIPFYDVDTGLIYVPGRVKYNLTLRVKETLNTSISAMEPLSLHQNIDHQSLKRVLPCSPRELSTIINAKSPVLQSLPLTLLNTFPSLSPREYACYSNNRTRAMIQVFTPIATLEKLLSQLKNGDKVPIRTLLSNQSTL